MINYSGYRLGTRSRERLQGVHADLVKVVEMAIERSDVDFTVIEGVRTPARQKRLFEKGASQTMRSRHLTGHAVDLGAWVDGDVVWHWPLYHKIADAMKGAAADLDIQIEWGGDWETFKDGSHFQLSRAAYPAEEAEAVMEAPVHTATPEPMKIVWNKPISVPVVQTKKSRFGRFAKIAGVFAAVTGAGSVTPALEAVVPMVEQLANGVGVKEVLLGGAAAWIADITGKNKQA